MDLLHAVAKLYSLLLLVAGVGLVYMSVTSQSALEAFWLYFAGLGVFFCLVGFVGIVAKLTRKGTI